MSKRTYEYVLVLPSRRLLPTAAEDDFVIKLCKIAILPRTVVTYLLKNVKHGIEHDIDSTYGDNKLS